jgi:hypothetical protein
MSRDRIKQGHVEYGAARGVIGAGMLGIGCNPVIQFPALGWCQGFEPVAPIGGGFQYFVPWGLSVHGLTL